MHSDTVRGEDVKSDFGCELTAREQVACLRERRGPSKIRGGMSLLTRGMKSRTFRKIQRLGE